MTIRESEAGYRSAHADQISSVYSKHLNSYNFFKWNVETLQAPDYSGKHLVKDANACEFGKSE
jgi:hypothetical protein